MCLPWLDDRTACRQHLLNCLFSDFICSSLACSSRPPSVLAVGDAYAVECRMRPTFRASDDICRSYVPFCAPGIKSPAVQCSGGPQLDDACYRRD